jgi:fatty-acyl-CoA synthase
MMLDLPAEEKARHDLSHVGKLLISSAPARKDTKLAILGLFPNGKLFELYGSTEAGWVTILRPDEQINHLGSVGREWAGSGAIKLLNADGDEVPDGEVGELFSRTAYVFAGYWKNPEKTAQSFHGPWCSVGDLARRDEKGFIHLVDRKSNMIISGGENIYPSEVEAVLAAHPAVQDVAVVGMPDAKWGESVLAAVVARPGQHLTPADLQAWCRARIAGFKRPKAYALLDEAQMPANGLAVIGHCGLGHAQLFQHEQAFCAPGAAAFGAAKRQLNTTTGATAVDEHLAGLHDLHGLDHTLWAATVFARHRSQHGVRAAYGVPLAVDNGCRHC